MRPITVSQVFPGTTVPHKWSHSINAIAIMCNHIEVMPNLFFVSTIRTSNLRAFVTIIINFTKSGLKQVFQATIKIRWIIPTRKYPFNMGYIGGVLVRFCGCFCFVFSHLSPLYRQTVVKSVVMDTSYNGS